MLPDSSKTLSDKVGAVHFWGVLKNELVYHQDYETRFEAIRDIIKYIELDYNQTRIQKGLGYRTPRQMWFDFYCQAA